MTDDEIIAIRDSMLPSQGESFDALAFGRALIAAERKATMFSRRPGLWAIGAREALELIAAPIRPDGTWNRDREACRQLALEALGRYED